MFRVLLLIGSFLAIGLSISVAIGSQQQTINFLDYPAGGERKQAFISHLKPFIEEINQSLLKDRAKLLRLQQKNKLNIRDQRWLKHIVHLYNIENFKAKDPSHWSKLIDKVDIIPSALALAQGAKESGWGSSRFAREGNNYFGQWCYKLGCGLVPINRKAKAKHEVAKYSSIKDSVVSYINNLNKHSAYKELREIRMQLRKNGQLLTGHQLARGLQHYSERGQIYVDEIQTLIRSNKLDDKETG